MEQQPLPERAQIACALFQIAIGQRGKLLGEFLNNFFNRPFGDRAFIHLVVKLTTQPRVGQQVGIEIENRRRLFLRACSKAFAVAAEFASGFLKRSGQAFALKPGIERRRFVDLLHQRQRGVHPAWRNCHARRGRQRADTRLAILAKQRGELRLRQNRRHLGGERHQEGFFALVILAQLALLDD